MLKNTGFESYHLTIYQTLTPSPMEERVQMAEWLLGKPHGLDRLRFSDEVLFICVVKLIVTILCTGDAKHQIKLYQRPFIPRKSPSGVQGITHNVTLN